MAIILWQIVGGLVGLFLGWLLVFYIPDRRHRRECLRQFNARVDALNARRQYWENELREHRGY